MRHEYKNLDKIFSIEEADENQIIIKVNAKDALTVAKFPFVESTYAYITVTRGDEHVLTVIYENGQTFSFHWGTSGYTLIGESLENLREAVTQFIEDSNYLLDLACFKDPYDCTIYPRPEDSTLWQLSLDYFGYPDARLLRRAKNLKDAVAKFSPFVTAKSWDKTTAATGITIYKPVDPEYHLR